MQTTCPRCREALTISPDLIGGRGQCASCGHKFVIAAQAPAAEEDDPLGLAPTLKLDDAHPLLGQGEDWPRARLSLPTSTAILLSSIILIGVVMLSYLVHGMDHPPMRDLGFLHRSVGHAPPILTGIVVAMELFGRAPRFEHLRQSASFLLWVAFAIMCLACVSGAVLHDSEHAWPGRHMIAAVVGCVSALGAILARRLSFANGDTPSLTYWLCLSATMLTTLLATAWGLGMAHPAKP